MLLEILMSLMILGKNDDNINTIDGHKNNIITPGISVAESDLLRETERQNREVLAREAERRRYVSSYTNSSSNYEIVSQDTINNCVAWAKQRTGIERVLGNGGRAGINSTEPIVGAIGAERKGIHAVVIEKVEGDKITILESNWKRGFITRRVLKRSDFLGFII